MAGDWRIKSRLAIRFLKAMLGKKRYEKLHYISRIDEIFSLTRPRSCPICAFRGFFLSYGIQNRPEALCPQCGSLERHRLIWLAIYKHKKLSLDGKDILHFAPERCLIDPMRSTAGKYLTADLAVNGVDLKVDLMNLGVANNSFDIVICNQILQEVPDDTAALKELLRILWPQGAAVISVAAVDAWPATFEVPVTLAGRERSGYFGYPEYVRLYGSDFCTRTERAGFITEVFQPKMEEYLEYGICFDEKIFICRNPSIGD